MDAPTPYYHWDLYRSRPLFREREDRRVALRGAIPRSRSLLYEGGVRLLQDARDPTVAVECPRDACRAGRTS